MLIGIIAGVFVMLTGFILLIFKSSITLIAGYEKNKVDDDKLRKLVGWSVVGIGFMVTSLIVISEMIQERYQLLLSGLWFLVIAAIVANMIYRANVKYIKK